MTEYLPIDYEQCCSDRLNRNPKRTFGPDDCCHAKGRHDPIEQ